MEIEDKTMRFELIKAVEISLSDIPLVMRFINGDDNALTELQEFREWKEQRRIDNVLSTSPKEMSQHASTAGSLSAYCRVGDVVEINLDHEFYQTVQPYINVQIDGRKYSISVSDIRELALKDKSHYGSIVIPDTPDNHIEMVSIPDRPMMAAVILAGLLAGGCKDKGAALINKAVNYADMILDYTKEENNDKC